MGGVCDNLCQTARKSLILNAERCPSHIRHEPRPTPARRQERASAGVHHHYRFKLICPSNDPDSDDVWSRFSVLTI